MRILPIRRLPTLVGWAVVLVIAMATSSAATMMITGRNIKDGTVTTRDVKNGSLTLRDLSSTTRDRLEGEQGLPGEKGEQGLPGEKGEPGEAGAGLPGSACQIPGGGSGTVEMTVLSSGQITLTCAADPDTDLDQDGYSIGAGDCNDQDPATHPGALEVQDGLDNNCDGVVDEGFETSPDVDGDGYTVADGDCDDSNASTNPAAPEVGGDGIDNDCDGMVDEPQP